MKFLPKKRQAMTWTSPDPVHWHVDLISIRWRRNGPDSVPSHQPRDCLLNRLFRRRSKKTSTHRATGLCAGNSPGTSEFPAQMASNAENVSIWWRHHDTCASDRPRSDGLCYLGICVFIHFFYSCKHFALQPFKGLIQFWTYISCDTTFIKPHTPRLTQYWKLLVICGNVFFKILTKDTL